MPWNQSNNEKDPWGRDNNQSPPDLDAVINKLVCYLVLTRFCDIKL